MIILMFVTKTLWFLVLVQFLTDGSGPALTPS